MIVRLTGESLCECLGMSCGRQLRPTVSWGLSHLNLGKKWRKPTNCGQSMARHIQTNHHWQWHSHQQTFESLRASSWNVGKLKLNTVHWSAHNGGVERKQLTAKLLWSIYMWDIVYCYFSYMLFTLTSAFFPGRRTRFADVWLLRHILQKTEFEHHIVPLWGLSTLEVPLHLTVKQSPKRRLHELEWRSGANKI